MMRSSSASYWLMRSSLLLELVDDNRRIGGETDMAGVWKRQKMGGWVVGRF